MSEPELIEVDLRCTCGRTQTEPMDGDAPARVALAAVACRSCGTRGTLRMVPVLEHLASLDRDDVA